MPPRLPITDEERRERKRAQDHNAHIRRMEHCGLPPRRPPARVVSAGELRRSRCRYEIKEIQPCV